MQSDGMTSITDFSAEEFELLGYLLEEEGTIHDRQVIRPRDPHAEIPLSFAQERLWFLDQWDPGNPAYNLLFAARVKGDLQVAAFERSLNAILRRHEALRTTFRLVDGQPRQIIAPALNLPLSVIDLSLLPHDEQHNALQEHVAKHSRQRFDLVTGPLLRVDLLRLGSHQHLFLLTIHHIIFDGWSIGVFLRELTLLYEAFAKDQPSPLLELPIQYADFAIWEREWLQGDILQQQLSYWQRRLDGSLPVLELPGDYPRPPVMTHDGSFREQLFPVALSQRLHAVSQPEGATLFMTLLAAFYVLLFRYTGETDLLVGSPIANRTFVDLEPLVGFFLNTLVLRADLAGNGSFRRLLHQVRETTLEAYAHQNVPFEQLVEELHPPRDRAHTPIFQVMFILQNMPAPEHGQRELEVAFERVDKGASKFDLTLSLNDTPQGLRVMAEYKTDLFASTTIDRLLGHYRTLLEALAADLDQPISRLPLLTEAERRQLLAWNEPATPRAEPVCIHQLFEAQAARTPDAIALVSEGAQLTYRALNQRANQLAHHLIALGVQPEERIGLCVERSLEQIVAVLGILKAGAAYLPLDPTYPPERLQFMVADAHVRLLLTRQPADAVTAWFAGAVLDLVADADSIRHQPATNPAVPITPQQLAYVIYTSGSLGQPKGVLVEHQSLVNYTEAARAAYGLTADDRVLQFASINFDASAEEIYTALTSGAALVLRSEQMIETIATFLQQCDAWRISVLSLPTAFWHELVARLHADDLVLPDSLRVMIIGGERALPERVALWQQHAGSQVQLINSYGPTEATVVATCFPVPQHASENDRRDVPIGRPLRNVTAYVLDRALNPVPLGVPGELCLGGASLARGYLNRPDLTAEKFVPDPFSAPAGARLYRTGDLVRFLPDGTIAFLGRVDKQVKVRGYRIETGEIEAALRQSPAVSDAVVMAREDDEHTRLVAYIVPKENQEPRTQNQEDGSESLVLGSALRQFLLDKLPNYMLPAAFVTLNQLPLTPSGKVNLRALPVPERVRPELESNFVGPRTTTEQQVAALWLGVLKLEQVGIYDNFFELGGHSLLATQLLARLRTAFQVDLPLRHLFASPTVASMAEMIDTYQWMAQGAAVPSADPDESIEEGEL